MHHVSYTRKLTPAIKSDAAINTNEHFLFSCAACSVDARHKHNAMRSVWWWWWWWRRVAIFTLGAVAIARMYHVLFVHASMQTTNSTHTKHTKHTPYNLVIVCMFHNEASYLLEWIAHHTLLGVQHFYLYDHSSNDHFVSALKGPITQGLVTLNNASAIMENTKWLHRYREYKTVIQLATRVHFHETYRNNCNWVLCIDIDEFIFCNRRHTRTCAQYLHSVLSSQNNSIGGIQLERIPFSTGGRVHRLQAWELQTATFFQRRRLNTLNKELGKIIYRTRSQTGAILHLHNFTNSRGMLVRYSGKSAR